MTRVLTLGMDYQSGLLIFSHICEIYHWYVVYVPVRVDVCTLVYIGITSGWVSTVTKVSHWNRMGNAVGGRIRTRGF